MNFTGITDTAYCLDNLPVTQSNNPTKVMQENDYGPV